MKTLREYINLINEADGVTNPWPAGTPHAAAWDTMSPEDKKWLGGADPTDKYILARAPNKGKPVAQPAPAAVATPVAEPTPVVATPLPAAPQQAANPNPPAVTPPKPPAPSDSKVLSLQNKLNALGAGLTADGVMGPRTKAAMEKYGLDADGKSTAKNVAAAGQPPATLAKDTNINQAQTAAAANAIKKGKENPDSLYGKTTIAQPTGPIAPTNVNSGSGVGKDFKIDPALAASVADNASPYDKAWLAQQSGGKPQAFAGPGTAGDVTPRPTRKKSEAAAWQQQYGATHDPATGKRLQETMSRSDKILLDKMLTIAGLR